MVNKINRAKQFLPFDALKGLQEALREKEIEYENKKDLSEDSLKELDNKLKQIEIGNKVKIKYYKNKQYIEITGNVTNIDYINKKIQINGVENINISNIADILI